MTLISQWKNNQKPSATVHLLVVQNKLKCRFITARYIGFDSY